MWGQEWAGGHRRELDLQPPLGYMGVPRWPVFCPNSSAGWSFYRNQADAALGTMPLSWPRRNAAPEESGCPSKSCPLPPGPTPSLPKAPGWYSTAAWVPSSRDMIPGARASDLPASLPPPFQLRGVVWTLGTLLLDEWGAAGTPHSRKVPGALGTGALGARMDGALRD